MTSSRMEPVDRFARHSLALLRQTYGAAPAGMTVILDPVRPFLAVFEPGSSDSREALLAGFSRLGARPALASSEVGPDTGLRQTVLLLEGWQDTSIVDRLPKAMKIFARAAENRVHPLPFPWQIKEGRLLLPRLSTAEGGLSPTSGTLQILADMGRWLDSLPCCENRGHLHVVDLEKTSFESAERLFSFFMSTVDIWNRGIPRRADLGTAAPPLPEAAPSPEGPGQRALLFDEASPEKGENSPVGEKPASAENGTSPGEQETEEVFALNTDPFLYLPEVWKR